MSEVQHFLGDWKTDREDLWMKREKKHSPNLDLPKANLFTLLDRPDYETGKENTGFFDKIGNG